MSRDGSLGIGDEQTAAIGGDGDAGRIPAGGYIAFQRGGANVDHTHRVHIPEGDVERLLIG